jgi:polar amino acid transport system substrate-binding protein
LTKARIWLAALVAIFALVVASCGGDDDGGGETAATGAGETAATGATGETGIPEFTTLQEGVLQVASCLDYPPFESVEGDDEVGFDVDLSEEIATRLGLEVEWITHDFDTVFTALQGNQFDMVAAASTITDERLQIVDFSDPYYAARQSLIVNVEETPDLTSTDQLGEGDVVGVQRGTTGFAWAEDNLTPHGVELKTFTNITPAYQDLEAGNVVGIISDEPQAVSVAGTEFPSLAVVQGIDTNENYGFATSKDNPELTAAVNVALAEIIADGTYAQLFEQYFPDQEVPPQFQPSA